MNVISIHFDDKGIYMDGWNLHPTVLF